MLNATIKDIARKANVSTATVSYVINKSRYVSPERTDRVQKAIAELGYRPHATARSLRSKRSCTIGLIVPDNANPFFADIARGVEDAGFEAGYTVILCNSNAMLERELDYIDVLLSKRVDGIIFFSTSMEIEQVRPVVEMGIATAIFYRDPGNLDVDAFRIDNRKVGYLGTRHLIELGHKNIACIRPASMGLPSYRRVEGFQLALDEASLDCPLPLMPQGNNRISGGVRAAEQLLDSNLPFTAIFAANDAMAIGAMRTLRDHGYQIPRDVSIVGVDDITLAKYTEPPLTTVAQPKADAGRLAVQYLVERMEGRYLSGPREIELEINLIVRGSTTKASN